MEHRGQVLGLKKMEEKRIKWIDMGKMGVERKMKGLLSESVNANTKFLWLIQLTCLLVQRLLLKQLTPECFVLWPLLCLKQMPSFFASFISMSQM